MQMRYICVCINGHFQNPLKISKDKEKRDQDSLHLLKFGSWGVIITIG